MTVHTGQSRGKTFAGYSDLKVEVCTCGVLFAAPQHMLDKRREDGETFYCPNGHLLHYSSENKELRAELKRAKDRLANERAHSDQIQASLSATKGVVTRQRKKLEKVVAGVCPVDGCKRHFSDLRRHIKTKHPGYEGGSQ